jgi:hypothetical protein
MIGKFNLIRIVGLILPLSLGSGCVPMRVQHTTDVRGQVLDEQTEMPIAGARIVVAPYDRWITPIVAYADAQGRFAIPASSDIGWTFLLVPGEPRGPAFDIQITAAGYQPKTIIVVSFEPWRGEPVYLHAGQ